MLDGIVFAHAVTVDKRERNALGVVPDVVTLSFDVNDGLSCATGGRLMNEGRGAAHSHVPPDICMYRVFGDHLCNLQHALVVPPRRPSIEGTHRSGTTRSGGTLDPLDVRASARGQVGPLAREQLDC